MTNKRVIFNAPVKTGSEMPAQDSQREQVMGEKDEVILIFKDSPMLYGRFQRLNNQWRQRFLDFCRGKKTLPLTYDPFFKRIFHPDIHPDRLSRLVSSILGIKVRVVRILPSEDSLLDGGSLLIMDLLGELEDGSLINIEIQKQGYTFPAERITCYSSDLVMRQYARVKGERGKSFTYHDIKKVYVIVIYEKSTGEFHRIPNAYIHHGNTVFDTGLDLKLLQEYFLIALDVFQKFPYPKIRSEQTAWLSLLTTENMEDAEKLMEEYPEYLWIEEIYEEMAMLCHRPEEVLELFSEALKILDENTVKYMIEELQKELDEKVSVIDEKEAALKEQGTALKERNLVIEEQEAVLKEQEAALKERNKTIEEREAEIAELKRQLRSYENANCL